MRQLISWATAGGTLFGMWAVGRHHWWGWLVGLLNQVLWLAFIFLFGAWGLLPLSLALVVVYSRNLRAWKAETSPQRIGRPRLEWHLARRQLAFWALREDSSLMVVHRDTYEGLAVQAQRARGGGDPSVTDHGAEARKGGG